MSFWLLIAIVAFLFFAGVAMTIGEGLWSNTVLLICVLISGVTAIVTGTPLGVMVLEAFDADEAYAWYGIFACIWGMFVLSMLVMRIMAEKASKVRVRFLPVVDKLGGILMGLFVAVMLSSFAATTLVHGPIFAGEWEWDDASDTQQNFFNQARNPFHQVLNNFTQSEDIDAAIFKK